MIEDGGLITFMADARCELTRAMGMVIDPSLVKALGNPRCKRFCCYIDDGTIKVWHVSEAEGDPAGDNVSAALAEQLERSKVFFLDPTFEKVVNSTR